MTNDVLKEYSSFRDNFGSVYHSNGTILRTINKVAEKNFEILKKKNVFKNSINQGFLVNFKELEKNQYPEKLKNYNIILEAEKINFISYPYEWTFSQLKDAALHHLNFQIYLLNLNCVLRDASAFNIQFFKGKPIFIDILSLKNYEDGEYWGAYKQFCENFLNPLLIGHLKNIEHNNLFRGSIEGLDTVLLNKILNFKDKISLNVFTHVVLQSRFLQQDIKNPKATREKKNKLKKFKKTSYIFILNQLKSWILKLELKKNLSIWGKYEKYNTYTEKSLTEKEKIVSQFVKKIKPNQLIDLGCNNGQFSKIAIDSGAKEVVSVDFDINAISNTYEMSKKNNLNLLPLFIDLSNPSPNQGWRQLERQGFKERFKCDVVIALAIEHHLIIGKNVPINEFIDWIVHFGKFGLLEFIPKEDETIKDMLSTKEDIYLDYSEANFEKELSRKTKIINKFSLNDSQRILYEYETL
jgi:ribosomal protein L11 methylase PrmA